VISSGLPLEIRYISIGVRQLPVGILTDESILQPTGKVGNTFAELSVKCQRVVSAKPHKVWPGSSRKR